MLPDFVKVKKRTHRDFLRNIQQQIPNIAPLLKGIASFRQHEGKIGRMVREDESESTIDYAPHSFEFTLDREEMKRFDPDAIRRKLLALAKDIGDAQSKEILQRAGEAADSVGNVVHAGGELTPAAFLEVFRTIQMDFDGRTGEPAPGYVWVMHPEMAASVLPKVKEWETDPKFNAEYNRIIALKREEWRDREANRKLVD
jgi:hypothetical protein